MDEQHDREASVEEAQQSIEEWRKTQAVFYRQQEVWVRPLLASFRLRPHQLEDAIQEVLLTIWLRMPLTLRAAKRAEERRRWIAKVAHNLAVDVLRREAGRHPVPLSDHLAAPPTDRGEEEAMDGIFSTEMRQRLHALMDDLKEKNPLNYRLLNGHYFEKRSVRELAAQEGLHPHAVTNRLARIRRKFHKQLKDLRDDADSS